MSAVQYSSRGREGERERETACKTSGGVKDHSHTPLSNHRQHDEGLNFITTCYGNEWAVASSGCVRVITTLQHMCE